ncbi:MAG TPA: OpgC domain-containing protein [Vicinamibacterales bacterium]|nr:OpgC domain-containing protein [Vicinamibacterales bacterium]
MNAGSAPRQGTRDLRIDWLRGLAMTCVIIDHSQRSSLLSWFSFERFWLVTAAEVFVVLSGVVLGMVYGPRIARDGWLAVSRRLGRRALTLYAACVAVSVSVIALSFAGVDVSSVSAWDAGALSWFLDPRTMTIAEWRDLLLIRYSPWAVEIIGLYVWLVVAAVPCLIALRAGRWRLLLAVSWALYIWYRVAPRQLTAAEFEVVFPILAWQLLFVHGIAIGYHRDAIAALVKRYRALPLAVAGVSAAAFTLVAFCNPFTGGPEWLRLGLISPETFTSMYERYFAFSDLGIGRLLNLAVALPVGYALLSWRWGLAARLRPLFVTLGQGSLGAFVLHVYGLLLLSQLPDAAVWINTLIQILLVVAIALALHTMQRWRASRRLTMQAA